MSAKRTAQAAAAADARRAPEALSKGEPDIEKLRVFSGLSEKEHTPFYAGRESLIRGVLQSTETAADRTGAGEFSQGATWLIQGAPGAGKTAFLREVGRDPRSRGQAPWEGRLPAVAEIPLQDLGDEARVATRIAEALLRGASKEFRRTVQTAISGGGRFLFGTGFEASLSVGGGRQVVTAPPSATLDTLRNLAPECWKRPLVVVADEIQDVGIEALNVLRQLHLGEHGLPIVPVYAGLASAEDALDDIEGTGRGLTRIVPERVVMIGRLGPEEAEQAVWRLLDECGVRGREGSDLPEALAAATEGWPQHLHNGMRILARALAESGGNLALVDRGEVLEAEMQTRDGRHGKRKTRPMRNSKVFVARLMRAAKNEEMDRPEILERMERLSEAGRRRDERLPDGMDAEEFLTGHLLRKGALQEEEDGKLRCPIPCLSMHLVEAGGERGKADVLPERDA